jgi:hypothetical protein
MRNGAKGFEGGTADFTGGGIFVDELRVSFFEVGKLAVETIVGSVGYLGLGLDVVKKVVVPNLFEEVGVVLSGGITHLGRRRRVSPIAIPRTSANQSLIETSRPGARRWDCSSRPPRRDPAIARGKEGKGSPPRTKPKPV